MSTRPDRGNIKPHVRTVKVLTWGFLHIGVLYTCKDVFSQGGIWYTQLNKPEFVEVDWIAYKR